LTTTATPRPGGIKLSVALEALGGAWPFMSGS
jgi:hypothetical protein